MRHALTPQERKDLLLKKMAVKKDKTKKTGYRPMADLNIVLTDEAYNWYKESRGEKSDE